MAKRIKGYVIRVLAIPAAASTLRISIRKDGVYYVIDAKSTNGDGTAAASIAAACANLSASFREKASLLSVQATGGASPALVVYGLSDGEDIAPMSFWATTAANFDIMTLEEIAIDTETYIVSAPPPNDDYKPMLAALAGASLGFVIGKSRDKMSDVPRSQDQSARY